MHAAPVYGYSGHRELDEMKWFNGSARLGILAQSALLLWLASGVWAQEAKKQAETQTPTFRANTRLVLVPTTVTKKDGEPVHGLKKDDFVLEENGKPVKVSVFDEVITSGKGLTVKRVETSSPKQYTNVVQGNAPQHLTIIALDLANSALADLARTRQQMIDYLAKNVDAQHPTALVLIGETNVTLAYDFTQDPKALAEAIKNVQARVSHKNLAAVKQIEQKDQQQGPDLPGDQAGILPQMETSRLADRLFSFAIGTDGYENKGEQNRGIEASLENLQHLAQAFAGVPGRKDLLWVTSGFPFTLNEPTDVEDKPLAPLYDRTFQLLNDSNMVVYPVDIRGITVQIGSGVNVCTSCGGAGAKEMMFGSTEGPGMLAYAQNHSTLETMAAMTGGRAFYNTNDINHSLTEATADGDSYYMLGYYIDTEHAKPGWRKLKVNVKQGGTKVRARSGVLIDKKMLDVNASRQMDLYMAAHAPIDYTGLPVNVEWTQTQDAGDKRKIGFALTLPAGVAVIDKDNNNKFSLDFMAVARDAKGTESGQVAQTYNGNLKPEGVKQVEESGVTYNNMLQLAPGSYIVRFVIRDNQSGKIGSVLAPLKVT
jgi:VWFA-related protein